MGMTSVFFYRSHLHRLAGEMGLLGSEFENSHDIMNVIGFLYSRVNIYLNAGPNYKCIEDAFHAS